MTREIKFRGKHIQTGEWKYGFIEIWPDDTHLIVDLTNSHPLFAQVVPATVTQYLRAKDREGREIYEGDILEYDDDTKTKTMARWGMFPFEENKNLRVVGNIFEKTAKI